jgi:hypothetical protein
MGAAPRARQGKAPAGACAAPSGLPGLPRFRSSFGLSNNSHTLVQTRSGERPLRAGDSPPPGSPWHFAVLSWQRLEDLPQAVGATWLDRQLVAKRREAMGPSGMGAEVEAAMRARRQWLIEQGLAREQDGQVRYARDLLRTLEARELGRAVADIAARTGLEHLDVKSGDSLTGVYRRMLTLNTGRYALIERSHDFALVPWRPVLERDVGSWSPVAWAVRAYPGRSASSAGSGASSGHWAAGGSQLISPAGRFAQSSRNRAQRCDS